MRNGTTDAKRNLTPLWQQQCDAARALKKRFGLETALDYLVGEKFFRFLREAATDADAAADVPDFVGQIRMIFEPGDLKWFFTTRPALARAARATEPAEGKGTKEKAKVFLEHARQVVLEGESLPPSVSRGRGDRPTTRHAPAPQR